MLRAISCLDKLPECRVMAVCRDEESEDNGCSMKGYLHKLDEDTIICTPEKEFNPYSWIAEPDFTLMNVTHYLPYNAYNHLSEDQIIQL